MHGCDAQGMSLRERANLVPLHNLLADEVVLRSDVARGELWRLS